MNEWTIKIDAPELERFQRYRLEQFQELTAAITKLAEALLDEKALAEIAAAHVRKNLAVGSPAPAQAAVPAVPLAAASAVPVAPAAAIPAAPAAGVAVPAPAPTAGQAPAAPTAPAPSFTVGQIGKAGADLIAANPAKRDELMALLAQFGVPAITALKQEQLGPFATALRGLGGKL